MITWSSLESHRIRSGARFSAYYIDSWSGTLFDMACHAAMVYQIVALMKFNELLVSRMDRRDEKSQCSFKYRSRWHCAWYKYTLWCIVASSHGHSRAMNRRGLRSDLRWRCRSDVKLMNVSMLRNTTYTRSVDEFANEDVREMRRTTVDSGTIGGKQLEH